MIRFLLVLMLVFAAPFVAWAVWRLIKGGPAVEAPTQRLVVIAALSTAFAMLVLAVISMQDGSRDGVYTPPSLEGGEVRPGRFDDREDERGRPDPTLR